MVREKLPNTLDVQIDEKFRATAQTGEVKSRIGRTPTDLFADFLSEKEIDDGRVQAMFAELLEESS
jgi:exonuclease SbcD